MMKEKVLVKVAKKVEVDMGQFKGLSKLVKDDEETGFEALELEKTKRMKQKARKEVNQPCTYAPMPGVSSFCVMYHTNVS